MLRLRYYRGHNVHSPFVFGLMRDALMKKGGRGEVYDALVPKIGRRAAGELQNIFDYLRSDRRDAPHTLYVYERRSTQTSGTVVILRPDRQTRRTNFGVLCIDKPKYMILFFDPKLPVKRFRL